MKKLNLIKRLWTDSHEKQKMGGMRRYAAMLMMLLTLGVGQMWAYTTYYLKSDNTTWNTSDNRWGFNHDGTTTTYMAKDCQFKLWRTDWGDDGWFGNGDSSDGGVTITTKEKGHNGLQFFQYKKNVKYNGPSGMVTFHMAQDDSRNDKPWVWITRPTFYLKHNWDNGSWSWKALTDHEDGTYTLVAQYGTGTTVNYGDNQSEGGTEGSGWGNITASLSNSPTTGRYCMFKFDASNTSVTITKLWVVQFNMNGHGSAIDNQYIFPGNTASTPSAPSATGYTFGGWYTNEECTSAYNFSTAVTADRTLYAKWTPNTYDVILDVNGGSGANQTVTATYNAAMPTELKGGGAIGTRTKTGYNFAGYFKNSGGTGTQYYSNTLTSSHVWDVATKNTHIYAKWTAKTYTVTLNNASGSPASSTKSVIYDASPSNVTTFPTKSGYAFDGYFTSGGVKVINKNGTWVSSVDGYTDGSGHWIGTSDQTLYAHWLEVGWYIVGDLVGSWDASATYKFDNTNKKCTVAIADHSIYEGVSYLKQFKLCHVQANTSAALNETLYGKNSGGTPAVHLGKGNPSVSSLQTGDVHSLWQELYYDGTYVFTVTPSGVDLSVQVPVIDQLQIYSSDPSGAIGIANYEWETVDANTVRKTVTLGRATYEFKPVFDSEFYGKGSSSYTTITRDANNSDLTVGTGNDNSKNLKIEADLKGDYTFTFDHSDHELTVTYPTRRQINYSIVTSGGGTGTSGSLSAANASDGNYSVSTGGYVVNGNSVIFSAPDAKSNYEFKGWYNGAASSANWSTNRIATTANCTITITKDTTIYAVYYEPTHTVSVAAQDNHGTANVGGSTNVTSVSGVGVSTASTTITATPTNMAWRFKQWSIPSNVTLASGSETSTSITIHATADSKTITAIFEPRYGLVGSRTDGTTAEGMPLWTDSEAADFDVISFTSKDNMSLTCTRTLLPNRDYKFQVWDRSSACRRGGNSDGTMTLGSNWKLTGSGVITFSTKAYGSYTFQITKMDDSNFQPSLQINAPTSHQITIGQKTIYDPNVSNTNDATTTGGNVTAKTTISATDYAITTGQYVHNGGSVVFTAHPATGYAFKGWYSDAACSSEYNDNSSTENTIVIDEEDKTLTLNNIGANKAVYAKYEEIMSYVSISAYGGTFKVDDGEAISTYGSPYLQVGVKTKHTVTIMSENDGYYFSGWDLHTSEDKVLNTSISGSGEDDRTITVAGLGNASNHILDFLRPEFKVLESIYFRNVIDNGAGSVTHWDNVYAFFDVTWNDGEKRAVTSANNSSNGLHVQMEAIGTTGIYRAYVPRYATRYNKTKVAFATIDMSENSHKFWPGDYPAHANGTYRSDYSPKHNMFVPNHTQSGADSYNFSYFNSGYWMHYTISENVDAGYWIERHTGTKTYSGKPADQFVVVERAFEPQPRIRYRLRIDGLNKDQYAIFSEGGIKYKANATITFDNCTDIALVEDNGDDAYFTLTPTAEGEYILTIDQSGDQMKLSVEYPIVAGDYVLEHTYTGRNKADTSDSTYVTRTNIIKSVDAGTTTRYSMYLNQKGATLKLRKCESINASGVPQWDAGTTTNVSLITDTLTKYGNGVYQFDMTINPENHQISAVDSVRLYTGNFYIKTDAASGGWVSYKNNVLTKNTVSFDRSDASTFDNYFCKYFASKDCNIKSVIANDYCNQLSDTVKGDGIARMYAGEPYVPIDGTSIRFSYNSATNETKRAYLGASYHNGFLNIVPSTNDKVYRNITVAAVTTKYDLYDYLTDSAKLKFDDNGNYVYEMDLLVKPGAKAGVRAVYNTTHEQMLIPSTNTLLGGSGSTEYSIRVVYDFKTNFMMSAFVLTNDAIEDDLADFDMLWVRHKDDSPTQLTLGVDKTLSNVRPIGAIEFRYDEMCSSSTSPSRVDLSSWSAASRPYLKYFISFPFNVHVGSVFGLNAASYDRDYVIQKYDGAKRAAEGLYFGDGDNYWVTMTQDEIMKANEGYCLILDNDYARWSTSTDMWYNKGAGSSAYIYFPAMEEIASIGSSETAGTKVPQHTCTINRWWTNNKEKNHMNTDSHWNMIGQPFFHDAYIKSTTNAADTIPDLGAYYYLDYVSNKWYSQAFDNEHSTIKAMSSIYVQWAGNITWTIDADDDMWKDTVPASAPRRTPVEDGKNYLLQIDVEYNGQVSDWAFVRLIDKANDGYVLREDMLKMYNNGIPNIYTFAGDYDVAYNAVPVKSQTIPMGVLIRKNGTYTFLMPNNFNGTVTLIDKFAQTRTNLALDDYEVYLEKGTIDDRFELEINIKNAPTAIDGATDGSGSLKDGQAHKFIMNDMMYILKDGQLYDARGNRVK